MKVLIDIPESNYITLQRMRAVGIGVGLPANTILDGVIIPDNATNGDMLQTLFPDIKVITQFDNPFGDRFILFTLNNNDIQVELDWWNAPYEEVKQSCNH